MTSKNIKPGTKILINDDISLSIEKWGRGTIKMSMTGTVQTVKNTNSDGNRIYLQTTAKGRISFHKNDVNIVPDDDFQNYAPNIEPAMFNINQLVTD